MTHRSRGDGSPGAVSPWGLVLPRPPGRPRILSFTALSSLLLIAAVAGCEPLVEDDRLVVATTWAASDESVITKEYHEWIGSHAAGPSVARQVAIRWIRLSPRDDLEQFARKRRGMDILLGGPAEAYRMIESAGLLGTPGAEGDARWLALTSTHPDAGADPSRLPRLDPPFLQTAVEELARGPWAAGYERLIRSAEAADRPETPDPEPSDLDGVAILPGAPHRPAAEDFLAFLADRRGAKPEARQEAVDPVADGLLADLLRATLIDSREELRAAGRVLRSAGDPGQSLRWMCEPPPWPPASVAKIQARSGDQAMTMIETLAGQIAPETRLRAWLLRSWLGAPRTVDGALLDELAKAEGGRLAREPRFRSWLRAEWTAWARQRYRRVARQASAGLRVTETAPATPNEGGNPR